MVRAKFDPRVLFKTKVWFDFGTEGMYISLIHVYTLIKNAYEIKWIPKQKYYSKLVAQIIFFFLLSILIT